MDNFLKEALDIVKAQASVRVMTGEEMTALVRSLTVNLKNFADNNYIAAATPEDSAQSATSIKEKSITCLECGKSYKIITKRHLALHNSDPVAYREKWGIKKDMPLVCKALQRERRKKMKDMKLWERRRKVGSVAAVA